MIDVALAFVLKHWRWFAGALAALALLWFVWAKINTYGDRRYEEGVADMRRVHERHLEHDRKARDAATAKAREIEERHRADMAAASARFLTDQRKADEEHERTLTALRAGALRVRERFACPRVPGAAADPGGADAEAPRGFGVEDAGAALGISADGDDATRQLNALIDILEKEGR